MHKKQYLARKIQLFKEKQIDRRHFVTAALSTGMALPLALSQADQIMAATPKAGGFFRMATGNGSTSDNLDPGTAENSFTSIIHHSYGNYLTQVLSDGQLAGDLAESFEASQGGKKWVFNLRRGVEFHNGKTMVADDVLASLGHHMGEASKSAAKGLLNQISSMRKSGDYQIIFELSNPNADFAYVVNDYHLPILPAVNGAVDVNAGIGTGGYMLEEFDPGVRASFKRNPNYYKSGHAHFDGFELLAILDPTARQSAVINGEVHHVDRIAPKLVQLIKRVPNLRIIEVTGMLHYTMPMRLDVKPFDNYDLRMAVKHAVDREEMVKKVLFGHGTIGNDLPFTSNTEFYNTTLSQRTYDPEKAAFHWKKSGFEGTLQLSTSDAAFAGATDAAQLVASSANKAGLKVEVLNEPKDGYWSNVWNKKGWCTCYWNGRLTQDGMYSAAYIADTEWNDTAWRNTDAARLFNQLVVYARGETDKAKRAEAYFEAQSLLHDDGGALVPMFANYVHATSNEIATPEQIGSNLDNDGNLAQERWWFA